MVIRLLFVLILLLFNGCKVESKEEQKNLIKNESFKKEKLSGNLRSLEDFTFLTENFAPYTFKRKGKIVGFSTDILLKVFEKLKLKKKRSDFLMYPWVRAYSILKSKPKVCLFGTTRIKEREKLFKWFGPIYKAEFGLLGKKTIKIKAKTLKDFEKYRVGTTIDFAPEQLIIKAGYPKNKLQRIPFHDHNIKKLISNRVDFISANIISTKFILKKMGENLNDYKVFWVLKTSSHYYACHKSTPDRIIKKLQGALDQLREEGLIEKIVSDYL